MWDFSFYIWCFIHVLVLCFYFSEHRNFPNHIWETKPQQSPTSRQRNFSVWFHKLSSKLLGEEIPHGIEKYTMLWLQRPRPHGLKRGAFTNVVPPFSWCTVIHPFTQARMLPGGVFTAPGNTQTCKAVLYAPQMSISIFLFLGRGSRIACYQRYETQTVGSGVAELFFSPTDFFVPWVSSTKVTSFQHGNLAINSK